jgi:hypothetical protein
MKVRFDDFKETIALALQNNMPLNAKLILVGRISYALECGELTLKEAKELEDMMGGRDQWQDAYEMALSGSVESSSYQMTP